MSTVTSVKEILMIQDSNKISNARVSVQNFDGTWREVGTFDEASKTIALGSDTAAGALIKAVRLDFEEGSEVSVQEIVVRPTNPLMDGAITQPGADETVTVNKTLLEYTVAEADALDTEENLAGINELAVANFRSALADAKAVLADETASQEEVNAAWEKLSDAIHMLGFTTDKTELQALIAECSAIDLSGYEDDDAKAEFIAALENAEAVNADPGALTEQSIAAAISRLTAAKGALNVKAPVVIDTSLLEYLLAATEKINLDQYVSAGKTELAAVQEAARAVIADPESQEQVNNCTRELNHAYLNMRIAADEELLKALKSFVAEASALDMSQFSAENAAVIVHALNYSATVLSLKEPEQAAVLNAINEVEKAREIMDKNGIKAPSANISGNTSTSDLASPDPGNNASDLTSTDPGNNASDLTSPDLDTNASSLTSPDLNTAASTQRSPGVKTGAASGLATAFITGASALAGMLALRRRNRK